MKKQILKNIVAGSLFLMPIAFVKAQDTGACDGAPLPPRVWRVTSPYGMRLHPIGGDWRMHEGIDLAAAAGTPVSVPVDGIVLIAGPWGCYGNVVVVAHQGNIFTLYAHLSRIAVRRGEYIRHCQIVGYVGATGCVTGAHLHFEVWIGRQVRRVNPAVLIALRRS